MKVLIVDDEPLARARLQRLLAHYPDYNHAAQASNGNEALQQVKLQAPDIVFLDVDMPAMSGLEVATQLNKLSVPPAIIFVTAHPEHALEALQLSAAGYLVKPVTEQNLAKAIDQLGRLTRAHLQKQRPAAISYQLAGVTRSVALAEVCYVIAEDKYTRLIFTHGEALLDQSLKQLEQEYPTQLLRIHRKILINKSRLVALKKAGDGSHVVALSDCSCLLPVSRRAYKTVKDHL
ncbi:response regulator transcription factor [Pseudoalteromonas sp. SR44-5]|uniref:LytR/AlgR family response regulator transcription factor n=1 Tax=unclassified Pseudoalteromonas TaxID=194690 RepID=UPI0016034DF3|nr:MULTISPECIES: LytTR family DNA-binding domain-containing protein [unclassified Pseudoalteromonas]MBB1332692.1 response regulator transcription factor [Pseudoalteromonas sp. SR41-6]MBB1340430.1 response regulator transcription factor [Pseudoalteromonas sp. SR45-6]MBB1364941.1 response regulator transcription factor [Pseudoalteromonas sp. SR44-5]MBB1433707.1 response regulator transcription factor [Pseudoalteromonas sp. SG43-6]MBB1461445.1 response regulator transcription factor [Pseudoaltero